MRLKVCVVALAMLAFSLAALATVHDVDVHNFGFSPANLTIAHGDTVHWHNSSGFHNVHHISTPSVFGNAQGSGWDYTFVFGDNVGDSIYHYECEVHPTQMQGTITVTGVTSAADPQPTVASQFSLEQNYPNPFNSQTGISFTLPSESQIKLAVFNVLGEKVRVLYSGQLAAGTHSFSFNANGLPTGLYYYRLETAQATLTRRMLYLK